MAYSRAHGMVNRWDFLTGSLAQLQAVWRAYHIAVQIQQGMIDHTPALYVIDQRGRERKVYLTQMAYTSIGQSAQILAQEAVEPAARPPARWRSTRSLAYISGLIPGGAGHAARRAVRLGDAGPGPAPAGDVLRHLGGGDLRPAGAPARA